MKFIADNIPNIIVIALLIVIIVLVLKKLISDRKKGKRSCGCSCGSCQEASTCKNKEK